MLRLRHAIERASRRRWLGLLVVLCLAFLLVFLVVHTVEHALEDAAAMTCFAVALLGAATRVAAAKPVDLRVRRGRLRRAPPWALAAAVPVAAESPSGFSPLRL